MWNEYHDNVIKWIQFPRYCPFVRGIHRSPVNSPHKGQWRGALMFSLTCAWINTREAGDLRRHLAHYDVTVMDLQLFIEWLHNYMQISIFKILSFNFYALGKFENKQTKTLQTKTLQFLHFFLMISKHYVSLYNNTTHCFLLSIHIICI